MAPESRTSLEASENPLRDCLLAAVSAFRVGRAAEGSSALVQVIDLISQALHALQDEELAEFVLPHLQEILAAQERGDVLRIADLLEFELLPAV